MKAAQISAPHGGFQLVERDIPEPGARQVRVKVEACGICHSDVLVKMVYGPAANTHAYRVKRSPVASMLSGATSRNGLKASASGLAGMADIVLFAIHADAA